MKPKELHKFYLKRELTLANHESTYIINEKLANLIIEALGEKRAIEVADEIKDYE